jgi:hypothetical protein
VAEVSCICRIHRSSAWRVLAKLGDEIKFDLSYPLLPTKDYSIPMMMFPNTSFNRKILASASRSPDGGSALESRMDQHSQHILTRLGNMKCETSVRLHQQILEAK